MLALLKKITLRQKVFGLVGLFFLFFIVLNLLFFQQLNQILSDYKAADRANTQIQQAQQIATDIEKLQRHVQNYTYNGYLDSAEAAKTLYINLFTRLGQQNFDSTFDSQEEIKNIRIHIERYFNSFNDLQIQRETQQRLRKDLRKLASTIEQRFQGYSEEIDHVEAFRLANELYVKTLLVEKGAFRYFDSLDSRFVTQAREQFKQMKQDFAVLESHEPHPHHLALLETIKNELTLFEKTFIRSVQHTRGYLSLVNVVMAAEAYEVLYYANRINQKAQASVEQIENRVQQKYRQVIENSLIGALAVVLVSMILAMLNIRSIVRPIQELSDSFTSLSLGKTDTEIPIYQANDEIGLLTQSAQEFQKKNIETRKLLLKSEYLSQDLMAVKERLMIATTSAQIGVWDFDIQENHLVWDEIMFQIYRLDREDFSSNFDAWTSSLHPDDRALLETTLREAIENNRTFDTIFRIIWPNGQERYIKAYAVTIQDGHGVPHHVIGVNYDITETENLKRHLEKRVEEELAKQREQEQVLIQQSKLAAMGQMISAISQQWNQPLNAVSLYLQDLLSAQRNHQLNDQLLKENIEKSRQQIKFMSKTIDNFQNFFDPDTEDKDLNLQEIIRNTLSLFQAQLDNHEIQVTYHCDQEMNYPLRGNANHLQQSLASLVSNAIEAIIARQDKESDRFKGQLDIRLKPHKEYYSMEIEDNGIGLSEQVQRKAFEPYFSTKKQQEGAGIGLYITRTIIQKYFHGRVELFPVESGGAMVRLRLPIHPKSGLL